MTALLPPGSGRFDDFKAWRLAMGLNTYQAAAALGIARSRLHLIEKNGLAPGRTLQLAMQALALGCDPDRPGTAGLALLDLAIARAELREAAGWLAAAQRSIAKLHRKATKRSESRDSPGTPSAASEIPE